MRRNKEHPRALQPAIPVSVVVVTKNEERNITRCLEALVDFEEIVVVDSGSGDKTAFLARAHGARMVNFWWNRRYPKKRQWCLNQIELMHPWVFFVDADEIVQPQQISEIRTLFSKGRPDCAGYFVPGQYMWQGKLLSFGLRNNKLCLFDRRKMEFPVVDDLDIPGMGELEGHYQPVLKAAYRKHGRIGQVRHPLIHYACKNEQDWLDKHKRYAEWERGMNKKNAWPKDPVTIRQWAKMLFRSLPFWPILAFLQSYVFRLGFLDGRAGLHFAQSRYRYYSMIRDGASATSKDRGMSPVTSR